MKELIFFFNSIDNFYFSLVYEQFIVDLNKISYILIYTQICI